MPGIVPGKDIFQLKRDNNPHREDAMTFSCLGKLKYVDAGNLRKWQTCLAPLLDAALSQTSVASRPLIIGLAESGIVPSAIFHQMLREKRVDAVWICSTRRPVSGISFKESHSHGPDHILPFPERDPGELWFVEDEITTGRTVLRLCLSLCDVLNIRRVRFFAIADTRTLAHERQFKRILEDIGIRYSLHALIRMPAVNGEEDKSGGLLPKQPEEGGTAAGVEAVDAGKDWHFPRQRPALKDQRDVSLPVSGRLEGLVLVVGEAVDIGLQLVMNNPGLAFHHVTLSPWRIDGKYIFSRLNINDKYYLYNYRDLAAPIYVLNDPIDREIGAEAAELLRREGFRAERLSLGRLT